MIQRKRVTVTVDPVLLAEVDTAVQHQAGLDRSKVFDEALALWYAARQEDAMVKQYASEPDSEEAKEIADWRAFQRSAAGRLFRDRT